MTRKQAVDKLQHVKDGILTLQGLLGGYLREVEDVLAKVEGKDQASEKEAGQK